MGSVEAPSTAGDERRRRSVLMICGDYMEDFEAAVPYYALAALGVRVDCVSPGKPPGAACLTAVHEFLGFELYTELPGHNFTINADFAASTTAAVDTYDALVIPGGRFTELLSVHDGTLAVTAKFAAAGKPIVTTCHSQLILAAAGVLAAGTRCTAFPSMKPAVELAGGLWVDPEPVTLAVRDRNVISAVGWPAHAELLRHLLESMDAKFLGSPGKAVLFLCGDYVEDYEFNVPFRALGMLGCTVDAVCPSKKKGETCVTAIYDSVDDGVGGAPRQLSSEKRGHNVVVTSDWGEVRAEDYDGVVVPGGRSPELLVGDNKVLSLVREFADKGKVVAGVGQGQLVLAAAGILKGRRCASGYGMKVTVKLAGGEVVESVESIADGKLLTATGWPALPQFISNLINLLGLGVTLK